MQVELYEIPIPAVFEILGREWFETVPYGCTPQMRVFQQPAKIY